MSHLEIERKFLIKMPDIAELNNGLRRRTEITQTYTKERVRLRRLSENGVVKYIKTEKKHITDITRVETESEISADEYSTMLKTLSVCGSISKTRYIYPYMGKTFEIDIFPFWNRQAFCEIELLCEDEEFCLPDFIEVIKEVTHDKSYRNFALSQKIPEEENF